MLLAKPQGPVVQRIPWELLDVALIETHVWYSGSTNRAEYESETGLCVVSFRCWPDTNLTTICPCF